jgi:hypothetical protein
MAASGTVVMVVATVAVTRAAGMATMVIPAATTPMEDVAVAPRTANTRVK